LFRTQKAPNVSRKIFHEPFVSSSSVLFRSRSSSPAIL
jgi:hypothetical protein